jgi:hypothetical protein
MGGMGKWRVRWKPALEHAADIVNSYGGGVTLRQLYYRLVADQTIPNTQSAYVQLSAKTAEARRWGDFPGLVDRTRHIVRPYYQDDPDDAVRSLTEDYRRNRQEGQSAALYVGVEKDALTALLEGWLNEYGIPVVPMRGWHSESFEREVLHDIGGENLRRSVLLYLGDLDPAGEGIEENIELNMPFRTVHRLALTIDQVAEYGLPENPGVDGKLHRTPGRHAFRARYGRLFQVEVDALPPNVLRTLVMDAVNERLDREIYESILEQEESERGLLEELGERWNAMRADEG